MDVFRQNVKAGEDEKIGYSGYHKACWLGDLDGNESVFDTRPSISRETLVACRNYLPVIVFQQKFYTREMVIRMDAS